MKKNFSHKINEETHKIHERKFRVRMSVGNTEASFIEKRRREKFQLDWNK